MVRRIYVQKKPGFDVEAKGILEDLKENLQIKGLEQVIILNRYDVSGVDEESYNKAKTTVFSEPQVDDYFDEIYTFNQNDKVFAVEYLPGQFDQRANSLEECLQIISGGERPTCKSAKVYILKGNLSDEEVKTIKNYLINSVDAREASLEKPETLEDKLLDPEDVQVVDGFIHMTDDDTEKFYEKYGFAMDIADLKFCQEYFRDTEKRDPTMTEMKMIDTYWSDHCRHTTFLTRLEEIDIEWDLLKDIYGKYIESRKFVYQDRKKDISLMDVATIVAKELKKRGVLKNLDESEEINALLNTLKTSNEEVSNYITIFLKILWPHIFSQERVEQFKGTLQNVLDNQKLPYIDRVILKDIQIGDTAPQITFVKIPEKMHPADNSLLFELQAIYYPSLVLNATLQVNSAVDVNVAFTNLTVKLDTLIQFEFKEEPNLQEIPFLTALDFSLTKPPVVNGFDFTVFNMSSVFNREDLKGHMSQAAAKALWNLCGMPSGFLWERVTGVWKIATVHGKQKMKRS